jgi:hypothetical protein
MGFTPQIEKKKKPVSCSDSLLEQKALFVHYVIGVILSDTSDGAKIQTIKEEYWKLKHEGVF